MGPGRGVASMDPQYTSWLLLLVHTVNCGLSPFRVLNSDIASLLTSFLKHYDIVHHLWNNHPFVVRCQPELNTVNYTQFQEKKVLKEDKLGA